MNYQVKELGIGGILDQSIALLKNRFGLILGITMVLLAPYQLVAGLVTLAMMPVLPPNPTPADVAEFQSQYFAHLPILAPIFLLFLVVVLPLTNAAITWAVANEYLGRPITVAGALKRAMQIILPFLGTGILFYLAIWGGMILLIIPGVLFAFWFALWGQIVVIEGLAGVAALKRSKFLMKGNAGKLFLLGLVVGLINAAISAAANFIPEPHVRVLVSAVL